MKRHSTKSAEHYTPPYLVEAARELMGTIDLDPASSSLAQTVVKSISFLTKADNGLTSPWYGNILINAPGSCKVDGVLTDCYKPPRKDGTQKKNCTCGLVSRFWRKLLSEFEADRTKQAIWIGFSCGQLELLQTDHDDGPLSWPTCFPRKRVKYYSEAGTLLPTLVEGSSPPQNSYISYLGPRVHEFKTLFEPFGRCVVPL